MIYEKRRDRSLSASETKGLNSYSLFKPQLKKVCKSPRGIRKNSTKRIIAETDNVEPSPGKSKTAKKMEQSSTSGLDSGEKRRRQSNSCVDRIDITRFPQSQGNNYVPFRIEDLHSACMYGDKKTVMSLLDNGADINARDDKKRTPLHIACNYEHPEVAMALIERDADIHASDIQEKTIMHYACTKGLMDIVMELMYRGADIDAVDKWLRTPLHDACRHGHIHIAMALIDRSADLDVVTMIEGQRLDNSIDLKVGLLHERLCNGDVEMFKTILETYLMNQDFDVNVKNHFGWTFLIAACIYESHSVATYLIKEKNADVALRSREGMSALHFACDKKNMALIELLLENGANINSVDNNNGTSLHWACDSTTTETAMMLLENGADVDIKDNEERTPLHWAIDRNHYDLSAELLKRGADINAVDKHKKTPLHWACTRANAQIVEMLLSNGSDVNSQENHSRTPLHIAIDINRTDIVKILLENGADVFLQDFRSLTPLHWAVQFGCADIVDAIVKKGGEQLITTGDSVKCTPLHWACLYGQLEAIEVLYNYGVDINIKNKYNKTPLHFACDGGHSDCVQYLVERGANVYVEDSRGLPPRCDDKTKELFDRLWYGTPLMRAMLQQNTNDFNRLLQNNDEETVNEEISDENGWTVLHAAVHLNCTDFVQQMVKSNKVDFTKNTRKPSALTAMHIACSKNNVRMVKIIADRMSKDRNDRKCDAHPGLI